MRKGHIVFFLVAVMLTLGFVVSEVQAGPTVNVYFQQPADGNGGYVGIKSVKVTRVQTGESHSLPSWGTQPLQAGPFLIQSGYGPILFRFEWYPGAVAVQVVDVWIQFPSMSGDAYYDIPAHNVKFIKDDTVFTKSEKVDARIWSSRLVDSAQVSSKPNQNGNTGQLIGRVDPWKWEAIIPMLDGCYSVTAARGEFGAECGWPNCRLNHTDWPPYEDEEEVLQNGYSALCVGGDRDAQQIEVLLEY